MDCSTPDLPVYHQLLEFTQTPGKFLKMWEYQITCGGLVAKMCLTLVTPWTVALQVPLSMGFSRQEYWSGLPFLSSGNLPNPGIEPRSPALQADCTLTELQVKLPLDCLICLRNLYAGQEAAVRTRHGPTHWFQVGKGVCQGCTLSSCLLNLYAEYIM